MSSYNPALREQALNPEWEKTGKVHDWRNYIGPNVREIWDTFTDQQKLVLATWADEQAGAEESD